MESEMVGSDSHTLTNPYKSRRNVGYWMIKTPRMWNSRTGRRSITNRWLQPKSETLQHTATHCNTLQHTATHCNTPTHALAGDQSPIDDCNQKASKSALFESASSLSVPYTNSRREVGGWGRVPFSRNLMSPTPRRKWYLTTGRRAH